MSFNNCTKRIDYSEIANLTLGEVIKHLNDVSKCKLADFKVNDLLNPRHLETPLIDAYLSDLSDNGVYLFYNENIKIRYVGQSKKGFYDRIMTQLDTTPHPNYGWNALLRKLGGLRTGKPHNELEEEDHIEDLNSIKNYYLLLVAVPKDFSSDQIRWLEQYIMKAYFIKGKIEGEFTILNTKIGVLYESDWEKPLNSLINYQIKKE